LLSSPAFAQVKQLPNAVPSKGGEPYSLINTANALAASNPQAAMDTIQNALELSFKIQDYRAQGHCYLSLGTINYNLERYKVAAQNYHLALDLFLRINDREGLFYGAKHLAITQEAIGLFDLSLINYEEALRIARESKSNKEIIEILESMGRVEFNRGNYTEALSYYQEVEKLESGKGGSNQKVKTLNKIGKVYEELDDSASAMNYYEQGRVLAEANNDVVNISNYYSNVSSLSLRGNNVEQAIQSQEQAVDINRKANNPVMENKAALELANIHLQADNSIAAIPYLKRVLDLSQTLGEIQSRKEAFKGLSEAYENIGNYQEALESYKSYVSAADSVLALKEADLLARLELAEQLNEREKEIELLTLDQKLNEQRIDNLEKDTLINEASMERQRLINFGLMGLLLTLAVSATLIYLGQLKTKRANRQLALKNLRGQMNPHFIFNALNSVNNFIASNDERSANKYLSEFSRLMRQVLDQSKAELISLEAELEVLRRYLELEHLRFPGLFEYQIDVEESMQTDRQFLPPMLIQPFLENAIWHGLRYRQKDGGKLQLCIRNGSGKLTIEIMDNGIGREKSKALKTQNQKRYKSTAMKNIEERMSLLSEEYKASFEIAIDDAESDEEYPGTKVTLTIPVNEKQNA
jgi:tetratricopeptide (TPR) repeat protein